MDKNDPRLKNLRPAQKGEVRNAKGINGSTKPQMVAQDVAQKVLGEKVETNAGAIHGFRAIVIAMRNKAIKGDVAAATWCRDTAYGKPVQVMTDADGNTVAPLYINLGQSLEAKAGK